AELSVGVSYRPSDKWIFNFDYNRAFWSAYRSLDIVFDDPNFAPAVSPRNYKDSDIYRFGLQYSMNDKLDLRAGYYYDDSPVQPGFFAPETPRNDSQGHTIGLSYHVNEKLSIDASFLYLRFNETEASFDPFFENGVQVPFRGTFKSNAFLPGIGVSYNF
ncbi:MAG: outer membrane protein transport protein, partial [Flavobacteriaceae bacterium]|nr:outer membrane protein transport protein [Flavobacteriaceae bacterium]